MMNLSRRILVTFLCGSLLSASACAGAGDRTPLVATPRNPSATGVVETRRTANQNTEVELEVRHVAPPNKVERDATVYVVWAQPLTAGAAPQNVGSLVVGEDRRASLKTKTPHERFDLIVTPEPTGNVSQPSHEPVMKAKIAP